MKTSVEISESLIPTLRKIMHRDKTTLRALIDQGLREIIKKHKEVRPFRLKKASVKGRGMDPRFEQEDWSKIRAALYAEREHKAK